MGKKTIVKQRDITDCGAACLASVAGYFGLNIPVAKIRQLASTDQKGTNLLGLIEAAEKLGITAKGVKGELEGLIQAPKPVIAHVVINKVLHHYVVIYSVTKKYVEVMDPGQGRIIKYSHDEFKNIWTGVLLLLQPNHTFKVFNNKVSVYARFWLLLSPHKSILLQTLLGAIIYTVLGLSTSIYLQKIIDYVIIDGNMNLLNMMSFIMIILLFFQVFIGGTKSIFMMQTGQAIDKSLILGYYKHLLALPQQFFDSMRIGEIISRINDAVKIRAFINDVSVNILVNIFIILFSFALMFTYYWKLALIILLVMPLYVLIYAITNKINKRVERTLMENAAELESQFVESINSVGTIKRFNIEEHANLKTEIKFGNLLETVYKSGRNQILSSNSTEFVSRLFTILLLWFGASYVVQNEITPGELLSFYALIAYFTGPATSLIGMNKTIQNAVIAADRLFEIIDLEREETENKVKLEPAMIGDITFKDVNFRYGSRATVFQNFNLKIPHGKFSAIIGESGSGKSTIASLLQNIYSIQSGAISIGDYDLKYIENSSLRRTIACVPQKIDLFAGNVIENIALGDPRPDMRKIIGICSALGIMDFIEKLPNGFNCYLSENGTNLSGGQRQRIAIARALYREPEILILDEATSALDNVSESYVLNAIDEMKKRNKTVILITHRDTTFKTADLIVSIENGQAKEYLSHKEYVKTVVGMIPT